MAATPIPTTNANDVAAWTASDSQDNATATATKAAPAATASHYITGAMASYSATKTLLLQIKDDTTVIAEYYIYNASHLNFAKPLKITAGKACSAVLTASGTGGTLGKVTLTGYTI
jgi:hypothetical protein